TSDRRAFSSAIRRLGRRGRRRARRTHRRRFGGGRAVDGLVRVPSRRCCPVMSDSQIGYAPITCIALPALQSHVSDRQSDRESVMKRNRRWLERWGSFLMGICIGLLIVTPVLAIPQNGLQALLPNESAVLPLMNANPLLDSAVFLIGLMLAQIVFATRAARDRS